MALVIIYAVLSHFDFVAKFTVKNLNKDFTNTGRGGHHFMKVFHKIGVFLKDGFPYLVWPFNIKYHSRREIVQIWMWHPDRGEQALHLTQLPAYCLLSTPVSAALPA